MSGSFYLKKDESDLWDKSSNMMVMFTVIVNLVLWIGAGWAIQEQLDKNFDLLTRPMEKYTELEWRDHQAKAAANCVTLSLDDVPTWALISFYAGALAEVAVG